MNNRECVKTIMNYEAFDRLPVVHFGYWNETLEKWRLECHITEEEQKGCYDGSECDKIIAEKLGFDFNWFNVFMPKSGMGIIYPAFEPKLIEELPNGLKKYLNHEGVMVLQRDGAVSIPAEVDHLLKDRKSWEEHFLPRLQYSENLIDFSLLAKHKKENESRQDPLGIYCGSLFGTMRNWLGLEGVSYLYADDEDLYDEIINSTADLNYRITEKILESGVAFDFGHFWEDICFVNGPLITPSVFKEKIGPHYKRFSELLKRYGIDIVSLDCDGLIDALIPTWLENGVNTMFPIEVGTWNASIKPWREKYGRQIRGVGGMNKNVFAQDYAAIDLEIERLRPMVELGGFIPCPDHRIPPTAKWENVQYYCDRLRQLRF